jgi:hypothetical protein
VSDILKSFLGGIAPTIASALLGPLGGVAVAGLTKVLGIDGGTVADVTRRNEGSGTRSLSSRIGTRLDRCR